MCGICGVINLDGQPVSEKHIRSMMKSIKHRGPDDEGIFIDGNVGLGFVRLSILDLSSAGHQPMFSNDGQYVVVYNGEIFNYVELREELKGKGHLFKTGTDTEVLLAAYQEWGDSCLERFNGMWAFVIYDRISRSVFASRDRYGIKPIYYRLTREYFMFASEISPLLMLMKGRPSPNNQAIFDFLVFNRTDHSVNTLFEGIRKIRHGCNVTISTTYVKESEWYNLRDRVKNATPFTSPDEFRALLSESVGLRLRSDVPVGVCLSGGLDSSSIVSLLVNDYGRSDVRTFSAVYNKGQYGDETEFIKLFQDILPNMFYTTPSANLLLTDLNDYIRLHSEPVSDTGVYAQFKVMELASKEVVVTLDGQGADEILAGYHYFFGDYFNELLKRHRYGRLLSEMVSYTNVHKSLFGIRAFFYYQLPHSLKTNLKASERRYITKEFAAGHRETSSVAADLYTSASLQDALLNHFEFKLEHLLKWADRNSMRFSVEARMPFLDHRLVERTLALPGRELIRGGMTKAILREAMKQTVPEPIRRRVDKIGFGTPNDEWFRSSEFRDFITDLLKSRSFRSRGIINSEIAYNIYLQHINGKVNAAREIWKWINLEIWIREFID